MKKIYLTLPTGWDKLTEKQLFSISKAWLRNKGEKYLLTQSFLILTGLKMKKGIAIQDGETVFTFTRKGAGPFTMNMQTFAPMVSKLEWLTKSVNPLGLLPRLLRMKGCNHKLFRVPLEDYLRMDTNFRAFSFTANKKYLNRFLSVVFGRNANWFRLVPMYKKQAVLFWFAGAKVMLKETYPYIFSGGSGSGEQGSDHKVVFSLLASLNNGDITRNQAILKTQVHEAFYQLNLMAQQIKSK